MLNNNPVLFVSVSCLYHCIHVWSLNTFTKTSLDQYQWTKKSHCKKKKLETNSQGTKAHVLFQIKKLWIKKFAKISVLNFRALKRFNELFLLRIRLQSRLSPTFCLSVLKLQNVYIIDSSCELLCRKKVVEI